MEESSSAEIDLQDLPFNSDTFLEELQKVVVESEPSCIICYKLIIQLRRHTRQTHSISITTQNQSCQTEDTFTRIEIQNSAIFKCDICGKELLTEVGLQTHRLSHSLQQESDWCTTNNSDQNQNVRRSSRNRKRINYAEKIGEPRPLPPETTKFITEDMEEENNISTTLFPLREDDDIKCEPAEFSDPEYDINEDSDGKSDNEKEINTTKEANQKHRKSNKQTKQFPCKFCHLCFTDSSELYDHCFDFHSKEGDDCKICGETFSAEKDLTNHILSSHKEILENPYKCTVCECDGSFSKPIQLKEHLEQIHPTLLHFVCKSDSDEAEKLFGCNICKRAFKSNKHLSTHLHRKHKPILIPGYPCRICKERFFIHKKLAEHFDKSHPGDRPFKCKHCNLQFLKARSLLAHATVHTGERKYSCSLCTKTFRTGSLLNRHLRVHTGEKAYGCDECGKYFGTTFSLNLHKRIHTGEKPYMCEQCSKCFSSPNYLNSHMATHAVVDGGKVKPHVCKECGKRFTLRSGLNTHSVIHTKKKAHQCEECGKCFALPHQLRAHCKTHTGE